MDTADLSTARRIASALSRLPGTLALLALAAWFGVLVGWAVWPPPASGDERESPPAAAAATTARRSVAPPSLYAERSGSPSSITETVQIEGGYAVLRFEPTYRVVGVTNSTSPSSAEGNPLFAP